MARLVEIWTDGACSQLNGTGTGPGGWAAILKYGKHQKELFGSNFETTNQQMELEAAIRGLSALKRPCKVKLYSDSAYLVNAMTRGWMDKWKKNGWRNAKGKPVANRVFWEDLIDAAKEHEVEWLKVDGHADNEGNNAADALAFFMAKSAKKMSREAV